MKKLTIISLFVFLCTMFFSPKTMAQAEVSTNYEVDVYLTKNVKDDDGNIIGKDTVFTLTPGIEHTVLTPIGNYLRKVQFKIDPENPIMQLVSSIAVLRVTMREDVDGDGIIEVITDSRAVLTRSGNLTLLYHLNKNK
ncbi:hypothetical protein [uncultured Draconibacterium sp.]|uniref:hypothetical protein n=1 Tax=uncultured Draconibacterium sp. TaxID=1573823 RepID=UPI003216B70C